MIPFCVCCVTAAKIIPVACACQQISEGVKAPENDPESPENPARATTCRRSIFYRIALYTSRRPYVAKCPIVRIASNGAPCSQQGSRKPAPHQANGDMGIHVTQSIQRTPNAWNPEPKRQPNDAKKSFARTGFSTSWRRKSAMPSRHS